MKTSISVFAFLVFLATALPQGRPASAGQQELRKYEATHPLDVPPPLAPVRRIDVAQLRREADELSNLAQSIPTDIRSVTKGALPKDVMAKLKRIEKLSKRLRGEIGP